MLSANYDPKEIESGLYEEWEQSGAFSAVTRGKTESEKPKKTFTIMMPPPNVTGSLHIGHALNHTLQDIIVRYKRMDGFSALWQPGLDHAGIATQNVVEKQLLAEGKTKEDLGRDEFIRRVWEWKEKSGGSIARQLRRLGTTPDWSRERFTMDEGLRAAVKKAFVELYNEKLIVQSDYMVNWCTHCGALSDIEVEHEEVDGALYHIKYPIKNESSAIVVATTRPETFFGDTAVMVNPADDRYRDLIGKTAVLPLIDREIKIIADEKVDMAFGSGAVKVTPAHDTNDYEIGGRHNLEFVKIFDERGILNEKCGEFAGQERLEARAMIVEALKSRGFIEKIEKHAHQVGHCYRCKNVVEPYISRQWFVKKEIAKEAVRRVNNGETRFHPPQWKNNFDSWMNELRDWCVSRQLWWGHRIPVFYCLECQNQWASEEDDPKSCPNCGTEMIQQDPDVLDTWFSSGLWAISTLGWGNETDAKVAAGDLDLRSPNDLLITGFDILFFWVARMLMMSVFFTGRAPFRDVYLHALVRDEHGQKMSKSKGNVIDPLEIIEKDGADTLRFTLAALCAQGRDIRLSRKILETYKHFANKIFNAAKFLLLKRNRYEDISRLTIATALGKYMVSRLNAAVSEIREALDSYRFNDAAIALYRFVWTEFCDWGIELSKADDESVPELGAIFIEALKTLSPFMPFLADKLYRELTGDQSASLIAARFPSDRNRDMDAENSFNLAIEAIVSIRRAKTYLDLANKPIDRAFVRLYEPAKLPLKFIEKLARVEKVEIVREKQKGASDISDNLEAIIPTNNLDLSALIARLEAQKAKSQKEADKLSSMLANSSFVANAPAEVLDKNRALLADAEKKLCEINSQLAALNA
ncbi:MAG: valine--tRNA ligase [Helicobacteraceae bacterium]|jgi:valyl-tRNA synthetase|nr:valine--tRNA ligase [Helicobacteraceae bacterium]